MMFLGFPNFLACNAEVHATLSLFSCFLAVTYNIDFALLLPLLLLLELNIVVVGAESRILVAPFFCFALLWFVTPHGGTFIKATQREQYTDATSFVQSPKSRWKQLPRVEHRRQVVYTR